MTILTVAHMERRAEKAERAFEASKSVTAADNWAHSIEALAACRTFWEGKH